MQANFGDVKIEGFGGDGPYCFEKAVVMRHNEGSMGKERKLQVFDLLRCNARRFCGISPEGKGQETNERGEPIIRLTLLMRTGSRSFKNASAVTDIFARECAKVEGCTFKVAQSENLSFCDQVCFFSYSFYSEKKTIFSKRIHAKHNIPIFLSEKKKRYSSYVTL
jgi:hypothetical protein